MNDKNIVYNFLKDSIPDDHPIVYQYIMSKGKSRFMAIEQGLRLTEGILSPPYSSGYIKGILKKFLKEKETLYKENQIKIKPIY